MRYSSYKQPVERAVPDNSIIYPDATIRQYLNMKRTTKDKGCLIIFLLYSLAMIIMMGIGFFYGNYNSLGIFINGAATEAKRQQCPQFVSQNYLSCLSNCQSGNAFLSRVCLSTPTSVYYPTFTSEVNGLISMYNIKYTFPMISYTSAGLLAVTTALFALIVYAPKIVYIYIVGLFFMLLGMAFYLLKSVELRIAKLGLPDTSIFYWDEQKIRFLSFLMLGIYLLIFPFVLFSPKKIQMATLIIGQLGKYFKTMSTMNVFTLLIIILSWGSLLLQVFLVMHFYSAGTISSKSAFSMFYTYTGVNLSHPASLTFHFIGVYWIFATVICWHKFFISSAMCLWYFQESEHLFPVKRGTAAVDAILMPLQWILLLCYSVSKLNEEEEDGSRQESEDGLASGCLLKIREFINNRYTVINRNSPCSAVLTNLGFFESCQISTQMFSQNKHRFFNIGGTLTIFLTLFVCMLWVLVIYFIIDNQIYITSFPPPIASISLPILIVFIISLVIGSLFANLYTAAVDCLLFCYLMERKSMADGGQIERGNNELPIKQSLDSYYYRSDQKQGESLFVYEQTDENTLETKYVTKKQ